jgi:hypothetical protein
MSSQGKTLGPAEQIIFHALGDSRWTRKSYTPAAVREANAVWYQVRQAVGFTTRGGWMTTDRTNPKLGKSGLPTIGVTLHAATGAATAWLSLEPAEHQALATALGTTVQHIQAVVAATLCPRSTHACRMGCVAAKSANAKLKPSQRARLARTLLTLVRPADALALTARRLELLGNKRSRNGSRWRVNIADDIRWELLAPGLFELGVRPYTYTKWSPDERPEALGMRIVYSATERQSDNELVQRCLDGHRVCVVFDLARKELLPATWHGIRVVDGDKTDDLWRHPAGSIVGLRVKGNRVEKDIMRRRGFARPVPTARPVSLQTISSATVVALPTPRRRKRAA